MNLSLEQPSKEVVTKYYGFQKYHTIKQINNLDEYVQIFLKDYVVDNITRNNARADYVFRGISSPEQKFSRITQVLYKDKHSSCKSSKLANSKFGNSLNAELQYIRKFEQNTPRLSSEYHNVLDLVATAQHNCLRTRLIDWTRSPLVATLFALHNTPQEMQKRDAHWMNYYMIMVVNCKEHIVAQGLPLPDTFSQLNTEKYVIYGEMLRYLTEVYESANQEKTTNYFRQLLSDTNTKYMLHRNKVKISKPPTENLLVEKFKKGKIFFLETNFSNSRITNQRGLFQLSVCPFQDYINGRCSYIDLVLISENAREEILEYCNGLGMNYYALMPDMQSIAEEINRKADEDSQKSKEKTLRESTTRSTLVSK